VDDFDPEGAARAVTEALRPLGTPERAVREKRYLKRSAASRLKRRADCGGSGNLNDRTHGQRHPALA